MSKPVWRSALVLLPLVVTLAACQPKAAMEGSQTEAFANSDKAMAPTAAGKPADPAASLAVPQLAYDYRFGFTADAAGVESLLKADQAACESAGVTACQMISLSSNSNADNRYVNKTLELRVSPQWLKTWQAGLNASVARAHGRISDQAVTSEDLSLQLVDTEAHLKNKEALRDRLAEIIRTSPGKVSELIEAETQLSQVQTDIDATRSALAIMQKRVATVHVTLTYQSEAVAASSGTFSPVVDATKDILRTMMSVLGGLIRVLSFLAPLALIGIPAVWYGRKWLKSRRKAAPVEPKTRQEEPGIM